MNIVIYHANCSDGFTAAWAASLALGEQNTKFIPANYGDPAPDVKGHSAWILDFSYTRETLIKMHAEAESLLVLDHHKTAQKDLEGLGFCRFDMEHSGAWLAWTHFHEGKEVPDLVQYIQDRDLWRWRLPKSKEISAALHSYARDFATWGMLRDRLDGTDSDDSRGLIAEGEAILRAQDWFVKSICAQARETEIAGHKVLTVETPILQSEVGEALATGRPFAMTSFIRPDGARVHSLRSRAPSEVDVSEIAKLFGGGGHARAAGYTTRDL